MVFQERLRDATGQDGGFGAGYEDVPLGFYRVRFRPARVDVWIHLTCAVRKGENRTFVLYLHDSDSRGVCDWKASDRPVMCAKAVHYQWQPGVNSGPHKPVLFGGGGGERGLSITQVV